MKISTFWYDRLNDLLVEKLAKKLRNWDYFLASFFHPDTPFSPHKKQQNQLKAIITLPTALKANSI